jgi:hypothetical protein
MFDMVHPNGAKFPVTPDYISYEYEASGFTGITVALGQGSRMYTLKEKVKDYVLVNEAITLIVFIPESPVLEVIT